MPIIRLPNGMRISALSRLDAAVLSHEIFTQETYAKHGITLDDGDCVFDVGANIGMFSLALAHSHRGLRLFLFEPVPAIFAALQQNAACHLSGAEAHLFNVGLAAGPGMAEFTFSPSLSIVSTAYGADTAGSADRSASLVAWMRAAMLDLERIGALPPWFARAARAMLATRGLRALLLGSVFLPALALAVQQWFRRRRIKARLSTISAFIREYGIVRIDLLKVDVEGAELDVISGVDPEDWPKIRQVVLEVHDVRGRVANLRALLDAKGFHTVVDQEDWALHPLLGIYTLYARRESRGHALGLEGVQCSASVTGTLGPSLASGSASSFPPRR